METWFFERLYIHVDLYLCVKYDNINEKNNSVMFTHKLVPHKNIKRKPSVFWKDTHVVELYVLVSYISMILYYLQYCFVNLGE